MQHSPMKLMRIGRTLASGCGPDRVWSYGIAFVPCAQPRGAGLARPAQNLSD